MKNNKVLIVIREFVPYTHSLGSSIRVLKMAEFFSQNGIEVYLLAAKGEEIGFFGYGYMAEKMNLYYVDDALQRYITRRIHQRDVNSQDRRFVGKGVSSAVKKAINEISIPDEGVYFVPRYVRKALEIINRNGIRNVIVSSPAHSAQVIGMKLKKRLGDRINLIVDYRDSWNTTKIFKKKSRIPRFFSEHLEKRILQRADHFVYVTTPTLKKINVKYFDISSKSVMVMNGYDMDLKMDKPERKVRNEYLTIGHFGFISDRQESYRNPELFFQAVLRLKKKIRLVLYGSVDIRKEWQERLKDTLTIHSHVSHEEALFLMQDMDILLQLHSEVDGADEVISGKIFEYILAEKPILVVGPKDMEAARFVTDENLGYCIDIHDEKDMLSKMEEIYGKWEAGQLITYNSSDYYEFSRQHQYSKLLEILE